MVRFHMRRTDMKFGVGHLYVGVAQWLVRWIANSVMRFQLPSPTLIDVSAIFLLHVGARQVLVRIQPSQLMGGRSIGRRAVISTSSFWPYSIEVITSGCLPENQSSILCKVAPA